MINNSFPNSMIISPAVLNNPIVENVPQSNFLKQKYNYAIAPNTAVYKKALLARSPRNNIDNDPACLFFDSIEKFSQNIPTCNMVYSKKQNILGNICANGGSNANFVRGNDFAVDYNYNSLNKHKYTVDVPKLKRRNDVLVSNSPFYPFPNYDNKYNDKYKTFPYINNFINGKPTVTYPYQLLDGNRYNINDTTIVEQFSNYKYKNKYILSSFILIFVLFILTLYKKK